MTRLKNYDKKRHLKMCLFGCLAGIFIVFITIINSTPMLQKYSKIGIFTLENRSYFEIYFIYIIEILLFFSGLANGLFWIIEITKEIPVQYRIVCYFLTAFFSIIVSIIGILTLLPFIVYDIYIINVK